MPNTPFSSRRLRLREELDRLVLEAAFISDPAHFFYLTGILPNAGFPSFLVLNRERSIAVVPALGVRTDAMPAADDPVDVITYANLAMADLGRYIDELDERDAAIEAATGELGLLGMPMGVDAEAFTQGMADLLGLGPEQVTDVGEFLQAMRVIKDQWEQEELAYAVRINDVGFAATQKVLRAGMTDMEAYYQASLAMANTVGRPIHVFGEFSGGPDISGAGSAPASGRVMEQGDILTADIYPVINGYAADTTRNFVIGQPAPWQLELHGILEEAMSRGEQFARPGVMAAELDHVVRGHLEANAPAGARTFHHMGHGIGIAVGKGGHHPPFIVPHSQDTLEEGMVITLEPGLYIAGKGGMRLEDNYVVTKAGVRPLGTFPKKLAICG